MIRTNKTLFAILLILLAICHMSSGPSEATIRSKVVKLVSEDGSCSGEQVRAPSGVDYILTAGHCKALIKDGAIEVITDSGKKLPRRVIKEDPTSDLLLLEGLPGVKGLTVADSLTEGEHLRTFTHGHGLDTYKTEGELIEITRIKVPLNLINTPEEETACTKLSKNIAMDFNTPFGVLRACVMDERVVVTDAKIVPGSSGGPAVNDKGQLMGVCSATDGDFGMLVHLDDINNFLNNY